MDLFGQKTTRALLVLLLVFNAWVWWTIIGVSFRGEADSAVYFLDVEQGDSELVTLASRRGGAPIKILIDGGRDKRVLGALEEALGPQGEKYIDVVMLTHPELDHYGGITEVLKRYDVGLFVSNGKSADAAAFRALQEELLKRKTPTLSLMEGDALRYRENSLFILSPDKKLKEGKSANEGGIVALLKAGDARVLFTADTGFLAENRLLAKGYDLKADVLKVGHHGSKYSSGEKFIARVNPLVAGIGVGKNSYGHPTPRVLETLGLSGARTYTTQEEGTFKVVLNKDFPLPTPIEEDESLFGALGSVFFGGYKNDGILTLSLPRIKKEEHEGL